MNIINLLFALKKLQAVDRSIVKTLYGFSEKSILALIAIIVLTTILLYASLTYSIVIWCAVLITVALLRFYYAYEFKKNPQKYSIEIWYKIFSGFALLTAFLVSMLGFVFVHYVDQDYQLIIVAILIGLSAGATTSLSVDFRISVGYISIILLPLIITMLILYTKIYIILAFLIIIYFLTQITILFQSYKQSMQIKELQKEQSVLHNLFKEAPLGIFSYDTDLNFIDTNKQFDRLFDHEEGEISGVNINKLPDTNAVGILKRALKEGSQSYMGSYTSIKGKEFWVETKVFPFTDSSDKTIGAIGIIDDKTKEHQAVKELEYLAQHDSLTDLLNRRGFSEYMNEIINEEKHQSFYSLLFYMDLNQFKGINDSLGHSIGDAVLKEVSKRLLCVLNSSYKISRLGGDEFIIILPFISEEINITKRQSNEHSATIQSIFTYPFIIGDIHLNINASMGIVIIEPGFKNIEEIVRYADIAMYQAKNSVNTIAYYDKTLDIKQKELFLLQHDLAYAAEKDQLELFFQPIVKMKDDTLLSAELLIRWQHPTRGLLSPKEFIPLAIKAGLLSNMTWWIVDNVCQCISQWKKDKQWHLQYISININAQQLVEHNFATEFLKKLKEYGLETKDIMIEITERSLIDNFESTQDVINTLRSHGIRCAIDDFGIGYSSLSYLKKLSFNTLKIDREFIKNIEQKPQELLLVSTILDIGRQFNYNIVIEGIEDKKQKDLLLGLDENLSYQGFYFSKPVHVKEFTQKFLSS